jgi:hypothetical protein
MDKDKTRGVAVPGLLKVVFDYPFDIGLIDLYFPVTLEQEGEIALIKIKRLEGVQVFDKGKILRESTVDGKKEITTVDLSSKDEKTQELVGYAYDDIPAFHHIIGDHGRSSYSWFYVRVEVFFAINDIKTAWASPKNSSFVSKMTNSFFNKFLLSYRDATNDIANKYLTHETDIVLYRELYVSELTDEEKLLPTMSVMNADFIDKKIFYPFFNFTNDGKSNPFPVVQASISAPLKNNVRKLEVTRDQALRILHTSYLPASIPIFNEVLLSSMERLHVDKDARMAIVDLDTAVEMTIAHYLFVFLTKKGKTADEIINLFDDGNMHSRKLGSKGYLTTMNRVARLEDFFNKELVASKKPPIIIKTTQEYINWNTLVRKRRNAAVHAWKQFNEVAAKESFNVAQKFIRYLQKIGDDLLTHKK